MDAISIWSGFDYAHTFKVSRNVDYYAKANRVKVIMVYKERDPGNARDTAYAKVTFLDPETGEPFEGDERVWDDNTYQYKYLKDLDKVRCREIFMRWDEYEDETEVRNQEAAVQAEKNRIAREETERHWAEVKRLREEAEVERQRIAAERRMEQERIDREVALEREKLRMAILSGLAVKGIATNNVKVDDYHVAIPTEIVKRWLGIKTRADIVREEGMELKL